MQIIMYYQVLLDKTAEGYKWNTDSYILEVLESDLYHYLEIELLHIKQLGYMLHSAMSILSNMSDKTEMFYQCSGGLDRLL